MPKKDIEARKEYQRAYYNRNRLKLMKISKEYKSNNRDKIKECNRKYRNTNKDIIYIKQTEYLINNREKAKERSRRYYNMNIEKVSDWSKKYYYNNKDKKKLYYKSNSEHYNALWSKRRKWILSVDDKTITQDWLIKLLEYQNNRCKICWKLLIRKELDHIMPLSKWWKHSIFNVQRLCKNCNLKKSAKLPKWQLSIFNL